MIVPIARQLKIEPRLTDQTSIALTFFNTILETATTRVELERSWETIEWYISVQEQLEARQRQLRNQP